ncbi:hypothetical protein M011DRAFT_469282 [Sporormia fimetaria CBS 119925]|uniref:Uncharacterized protein n=1 Tax=Sporormia fimetaria CBS 119925 TaxID=1340428 RepID=A0A6A6V8Z5_9PLEO|nr:hypothetical protein M011DRAFT_469282 [Sporormia fimetaria CBS 119925]
MAAIVNGKGNTVNAPLLLLCRIYAACYESLPRTVVALADKALASAGSPQCRYCSRRYVYQDERCGAALAPGKTGTIMSQLKSI